MREKVKNELGLVGMILGFGLVGILFMTLKPSFWFVSSIDTFVFGVLMLITGVMYVPGLLYKVFCEK